MKFYRISTLIWRDYLIFFKERWRWIEFFYFPITSLVIWGLFALWTKEFASLAGKIALVINIFWSYAYIVQSTINSSINEDIWHREIHHLFATGLGKWEYLIARILFSLIISLPNLLFMLIVAHIFFFNLSQIIIPLFFFLILTAFLAVSLSMFITGLILILGIDFAWLGWSATQFFILLSFPFTPFENLPPALQVVAKIMPFGELFEGIRGILLNTAWLDNIALATFVGIAYFLFSVLFYRFGFDYSRKSGKLVKGF